MTSNDTLVDQRPFYFYPHRRRSAKRQSRLRRFRRCLRKAKTAARNSKRSPRAFTSIIMRSGSHPNDPKRIIIGEDGGYALTTDGGKNWSFSRNLAIGQIYHVGLSNENPYSFAAACRTTTAFCGPSNSLDREGIQGRRMDERRGRRRHVGRARSGRSESTSGRTLQDGRIAIYDRADARRTASSIPYYDFREVYDFDYRRRKYRFNWDSPIAFAPWDRARGVVRRQRRLPKTDRGEQWTAISPDLTRNIKAHQQPSGGPLALDVSGAEYSDTILYIEGSPLDTKARSGSARTTASCR